MLTLGGLLFIGLGAYLGWRRGASRIGVTLVALVLASLLASPLHFTMVWLVELTGLPELLVPAAASLTAGVLIFLIVAIPAHWRLREIPREEPNPWDPRLGAFLGAVWGALLLLLVLAGLGAIARADRAMRQGTAFAQAQAAMRLKQEREVERRLAPLRTAYTPEKLEVRRQELLAETAPRFTVDPRQVLEQVPEGPLDGYLDQLDDSLFSAAVELVNPVDSGTETILRELTIVVGDPVLFDRLQRHPVVSEVMHDPTVQALSKDPDIALAIQEARYRDLLDHPSLVKAVRDEEVRARFSRVDLPAILAQVRAGR